MTGNDAMKCAAELKGAGSSFRSIRFIPRCTGRNNNKKIPASAITNFLETDENKLYSCVRYCELCPSVRSAFL
jgi:hypothetical protein